MEVARVVDEPYDDRIDLVECPGLAREGVAGEHPRPQADDRDVPRPGMNGAEPGEELSDRAALIIVPDLGPPPSRIGELGAVNRRAMRQSQHRSIRIDYDPMNPEKAAFLL